MTERPIKNATAEEAEAAPVRFGKRAVLSFGAVLATAIALAIAGWAIHEGNTAWRGDACGC